MTVKQSLRIAIFALSAIMLTAIFQNCSGQRAFYARQAFVPVSKLEGELVNTYGASLSPSMCGVAEKYSCQRKVFGHNLANTESNSQFECVVIDGNRICPEGKTYTYNSAAAEASCKENCSEDYNYEEYFCTYDLATVDGIRPLQAIADTLEESIEATYLACVRVGDKAQGIE